MSAFKVLKLQHHIEICVLLDLEKPPSCLNLSD